MTVTIIENWSDVVGWVQNISAAPGVQGFSVIDLTVSEVKDVEPYANLLSSVVGTSIGIHLPAGVLEELDLDVGALLACRVRLAKNQKVFAHTEEIRVLDR
jgi:hypothetical protein